MEKARLVKGDLPGDLFEDFKHRGELAMDCEMMGLNPIRDRLCVVQIAADDGPCALLQVNENLAYPNLKSLLENENVAKIFHYARLDCVFLRMRLGIQVKNIVCTKIMSRLVRTYTDRHSLKELVRELIGDKLDKSNQTSDWGREDLTADQLYYAEMDVRHLFAAKRKLVEMLNREDRHDLAMKTLAFLPVLVELDSQGYESIFEH